MWRESNCIQIQQRGAGKHLLTLMLYRYGFVNFRSLAHLEYFARERLGEKWGMFMSDKVLQVRQ